MHPNSPMSRRRYAQLISGTINVLRQKATTIFTMLLALSLAANGEAANAQSKIVSAHLMPQESVGADILPRDEALREQTGANQVLAHHLPEYLINKRSPDAAAEQDIEIAEGAGVNTFNMLLAPHHLTESQFARVSQAYWQAALSHPEFKMDVDIWGLDPQKPDTIDNLRDELKYLHDNYGEAWRTYNGKYVVMLYLGKPSPGKTLSATDINRLFDGMGGRKSVFLVLYDPTAWKQAGSDLFSSADAYTDWLSMPYSQSVTMAAAGAATARAAGKPYWYPVMPSFMQSRPWGGVVANNREKLGASSFTADWERAIAGDAQAVNITTWNDLTEDSALMPESNHHYAFYDLNKYYALKLEYGSVSITKDQVYVFHHPQLVGTGNWGRRPFANFAWAAKPPSTDYVMVVATLRSAKTIGVSVAGKRLGTLNFPAGLHYWLLYNPAPGSSSNQYPSNSGRFTVTPISNPFDQGSVTVSVTSANGQTSNFQSSKGILPESDHLDLTVSADVFTLN